MRALTRANDQFIPRAQETCIVLKGKDAEPEGLQEHRRAESLNCRGRKFLAMNQSSFSPTIDEYFRKRLMPVEGAIPQLAGIDMYGNSIPAGTVGGDLFEYINFQQRYDIDGRIARALKLAKLYLDPLPTEERARNMVDDHVCWLENRPDYEPSMALEYRKSKSSEQLHTFRRMARTRAGIGGGGYDLRERRALAMAGRSQHHSLHADPR